ncbi:MAG: hypothetical protein WCW87_01135 [Candidatus Paceibacterota bacterium]
MKTRAFIFLFVFVFLGSFAFCNPYDPYMGNARKVIKSVNGAAPSWDKIVSLTRQAYKIRYSFDPKINPYTPQSPQETERLQSGDCKAKSLWLIQKLNYPGAKFCIGKMTRSSPGMSHAWVEIQYNGRKVVLDPTNYPDPQSPSNYFPHYKW